MKNQLNVRHTVKPDSHLTYAQWCKKYNVSSQWYEKPQNTNLMHDYRWDIQEKSKSFLIRLINHIIKLVNL